MDARSEAAKRYPAPVGYPCLDMADDGGRAAAERAAFLAGAAWALREFGTALDSVPDYRASAYDEGRVDQRRDDAVAALVRADSIERDR